MALDITKHQEILKSIKEIVLAVVYFLLLLFVIIALLYFIFNMHSIIDIFE